MSEIIIAIALFCSNVNPSRAPKAPREACQKELIICFWSKKQPPTFTIDTRLIDCVLKYK